MKSHSILRWLSHFHPRYRTATMLAALFAATWISPAFCGEISDVASHGGTP